MDVLLATTSSLGFFFLLSPKLPQRILCNTGLAWARIKMHAHIVEQVFFVKFTNLRVEERQSDLHELCMTKALQDTKTHL